MKSAGKARNNGLYRHIRTSKEIIRNLLNDYFKKCIGRLMNRILRRRSQSQQASVKILKNCFIFIKNTSMCFIYYN